MKLGVNKNVKIISCYIGESKEKKTPFFGLEFQNDEGETIEKDFYLTEKTQEKNLELLIDAGYKGKSLADMADPKFSVSDLFGAPKDELSVTVIDEPYTDSEGNEQTRKAVQWFNVGYKGKTKADHQSAKLIFKNSSFDGLLSKIKKGEVKPSASKPKESMQADPPGVDESDVPF